MVAVKDDIELRAGAAAAHVLGAKLIRRDTGGRRIRDFDLVLPDGSLEPLEVTRHVDQQAYQTWERLRTGTFRAPSLTQVWAVAVPASAPTAAGGREPHDVRKLQRELEPALARLAAEGADQAA